MYVSLLSKNRTYEHNIVGLTYFAAATSDETFYAMFLAILLALVMLVSLLIGKIYYNYCVHNSALLLNF